MTKEKEIVSCEKILYNFENYRIKLATTTQITNEAKYQILCVITQNDEIILRYVSDTAEIILKKVDWFSEKKKIIKGTFNISNILRYVD